MIVVLTEGLVLPVPGSLRATFVTSAPSLSEPSNGQGNLPLRHNAKTLKRFVLQQCEIDARGSLVGFSFFSPTVIWPPALASTIGTSMMNLPYSPTPRYSASTLQDVNAPEAGCLLTVRTSAIIFSDY